MMIFNELQRRHFKRNKGTPQSAARKQKPKNSKQEKIVLTLKNIGSITNQSF
jgi:hypothetical protein